MNYSAIRELRLDAMSKRAYLEPVYAPIIDILNRVEALAEECERIYEALGPKFGRHENLSAIHHWADEEKVVIAELSDQITELETTIAEHERTIEGLRRQLNEVRKAVES